MFLSKCLCLLSDAGELQSWLAAQPGVCFSVDATTVLVCHFPCSPGQVQSIILPIILLPENCGSPWREYSHGWAQTQEHFGLLTQNNSPVINLWTLGFCIWKTLNKAAHLCFLLFIFLFRKVFTNISLKAPVQLWTQKLPIKICMGCPEAHKTRHTWFCTTSSSWWIFDLFLFIIIIIH